MDIDGALPLIPQTVSYLQNFPPRVVGPTDHIYEIPEIITLNISIYFRPSK